jgi:hypothetical protein
MPLSSNSSQGLYSPDSHFAQAAYDATLAGSSWGVGAGGYVETVNPQNTSKKRSHDAVNDFFDDVKRHKIAPVYNDGIPLSRTFLTSDMADRLSDLQTWTDDIFRQSYNTYQVPSMAAHNQYAQIPAFRSRQDLLEFNQFLTQLHSHGFEPQYPEYLPQYPSYNNKTLYPTLDLDYAQQADVTPSTNLYPQLFDQTQSPISSSNYVGMGSRMAYDPAKLVFAGTLQKAPPRAGSEELVQDMEKMVVDSESKEKKPEEEVKVKLEEDVDQVKAKHLDLIKKLQKLVQEMLLEEDSKVAKEIKKESPVSDSTEKFAPIAAH